MRFIHIADMHFDTPFTFLGEKENLGDIRRLEQRQIFQKVINYINSFEMHQTFQQPMGQTMNQNFQQPMPAMQQQFVNQQTVGQNQMPNNINRQ